jgi:hypothetical protein
VDGNLERFMVAINASGLAAGKQIDNRPVF